MAIQAAELIAKITVDGAETAASKIASFAEKLGPAGPLVAGAAALGVALVGVGVASVKMAADYEQKMNMVKALTGSSQQQMDFFNASLDKLAINAGVAPSELADGLYRVISAGFKGKEAMTVLTLATEDAKIGMTDAATTTRALSAVINNFHVPAKDFVRVNGEMLETVTLGEMSMNDYATSIAKAAIAAVPAHVSMEQMNATIATLTAHSIPARQAVTDFTQVLQLMGPHLDTLVKSLDKGGIAFDTTKFQAMDYSDKVQYLAAALQEATDKHIKLSGTQQNAVQLLRVLSQNQAQYNENLKTLSDRQAMAKKTEEAWADTQKGFNQQMDRLGAAFDVVLKNIGTFILKGLTPLVSWFTDRVMPRLLDFAYWLANKGPAAMQQAENWLNQHVVPALQNLWNWIQTKAVPALSNLWNWLTTQVIPASVNWYNKLHNDLGPEVVTVAGHIVDAANSCQTLANKLKPLYDSTGNVNHQMNLLDETMQLVDDGINAVMFFVDAAALTIQNAADGINRAINAVKRTGNALVHNDWAGTWSGLWDILLGTVQFFAAPIMATIQAIVDAWNNAVHQVSGGAAGYSGSRAAPSVGHGGGAAASFAEGTDNAPGGMAWVGEQGPELMYVPKGAQIIPSGQSRALAASSGGGGQTVIMQIDGRTFARVVLPHLTNQIRYSVGTHAY